MPILAGGVIVAALLLAWAGVELDHLIRAYPGQFYMAFFAVLIVAVATGTARFYRVTHDRVPLAPPPPPPLPKALKAAPVLTAIAGPDEAEDAQDCEGPGCASKVDDDPWLAMMPGEEDEHVFCSKRCAEAWRDEHRSADRPV
jgi:hypothetical protein